MNDEQLYTNPARVETRGSRIEALLFAAFMLAGPALAFATVTTTNNGDGTTTLRATYTIPTTAAADARDDICRGAGWTSTVTCTSAMVTAGQCTSAQLGTSVANPETCLQAIDRTVRTMLRELRKAGEVMEADTTFVKPVRDSDKTAEIQ